MIGDAAGAKATPGPASPTPRQLQFDRVDSRRLLQLARRIYIDFLRDASVAGEPIGIAICLERQTGRAVFARPLLLPGEQFIPLNWIRNQPGNQRASPTAARTPSRRSSSPRSASGSTRPMPPRFTAR